MVQELEQQRGLNSRMERDVERFKNREQLLAKVRQICPLVCMLAALKKLEQRHLMRACKYGLACHAAIQVSVPSSALRAICIDHEVLSSLHSILLWQRCRVGQGSLSKCMWQLGKALLFTLHRSFC